MGLSHLHFGLFSFFLADRLVFLEPTFLAIVYGYGRFTVNYLALFLRSRLHF